MHGRREINLRLSRLVVKKQPSPAGLVNNVVIPAFHCWE